MIAVEVVRFVNLSEFFGDYFIFRLNFLFDIFHGYKNVISCSTRKSSA